MVRTTVQFAMGRAKLVGFGGNKMSASAVSSPVDPARPVWRDPSTWARTADVVAVLIAASLPWSTTLVSIFMVVWFVTLVPTLRIKPFLHSLARPECVLPIALFLLAVVGTLWAADIPWAARLRGINPTAKLLAIPFLIFHFEQSSRGRWVFAGFLISCTVLMLASWMSLMVPTLTPTSSLHPGVPVKNYIDQSQAFALCAVVIAWPALELFRERRFASSIALVAISLAFIANMIFAIVARTALIYVPVMLLVFGFIRLRRRDFLIALLVGVIVVALAWLASPNLQTKTESIFLEFAKYKTSNELTSVGMRLEFWRKSLIFFEEAPLAGHGTGSTQTLFDRAATGQTPLAALTVSNPHNQTLNVAVQWGVIGCAVLYAMWFVHFGMFRGKGFVAWVGLLAVVQNVISSLFNSHLFDFVPGWIYVMSVGVAGGMMLQVKNKS
jgi:O-antigen ligase